MTNMKTVMVVIVVVMTAFASWVAGPQISDTPYPLHALREENPSCRP